VSARDGLRLRASLWVSEYQDVVWVAVVVVVSPNGVPHPGPCVSASSCTNSSTLTPPPSAAAATAATGASECRRCCFC